MTNWLPISELFDFEKGTVQSTKATSGEYTFITAGEDWKTHNEYTHDCEALVFAMGASGSLGRTHYVSGKFISSDLCFILTPKKDKKIDLLFYYRIFNFIRADIVKATARGTSKLAINQRNFGKYQLPYFDFDHQMLFRDKLDNLNSNKEKLILELGLQQNHLIKLRQSILQDAIEGKLTEVWRKQNPVINGDLNTDAHALLEQIKAEKKRLIAEGKIKKEKPLPPIDPNEIPFELPDGWVWVRLGDYVDIERGRFSIRPRNDPRYFGGKYPFIQIGSLDKNGSIIFNYKQTLNEAGLKSSKMFEAGTIAIALVGGTIGNLGVLGLPMCFPDSMAGIRPSKITVHEFVLNFLRLKRVDLLKASYQMAGQPNIKLPNLTHLIVGLPSLNEQRQIIDCLNDLMSVTEDFEQMLEQNKDYTQKLMHAVLKEAFTPS